MRRAARATRPARDPFRQMIRGGALAVGAATAPLALVVALLGRGPAGVFGVLGGALVVAVVFASGIPALRAVLGPADGPSGLAMPGAFVVYVGQLLVLTALAVAVAGQPWIDRPAIAAGAIAATLAWQVGQIRGFATARILAFGGLR